MQIRQWYYGKHEITQNGRMGIRLPYKQIEHVYYTSDMLVRKVTGYIIICRKSLNNGISKIHPGENESDGMAMDVVTTSTTTPVCVTTTYTSNLSFIKPANT